MKCAHIDTSGDGLTECGNEDFDLNPAAFLTVDLSGDPDAHTVDFEGLSRDGLELRCKRCGGVAEGIDFDKTVTRLLIRLEKRLGATLPQFSSYTFEDGTVIDPATVTP